MVNLRGSLQTVLSEFNDPARVYMVPWIRHVNVTHQSRTTRGYPAVNLGYVITEMTFIHKVGLYQTFYAYTCWK